MADYAGQISVPLQKKKRCWNTHCGVNLVNVSLPAKESDNQEPRNDQGREDVGSGPSLNRTGCNGEDEKDNCRCRSRELVISQRQWRLSKSQESVTIPNTSKRALEIDFENPGMKM